MKRNGWMMWFFLSLFPVWCLAQSPAELIKQGRALVCDRKYAEAQNAFESALVAAPGNLEATIGKIDALGYLRKLSDVEAFIASQFASDPAKATIAGAYLKIWKRDYDGAAADLKNVAADGGDAYLVAYLSGYIQFIKKNWDQAIPQLEKAIQLNQSHSQSYFLLGDVYRIKDDAEKVTRYWGKYLEMVPKGNSCTDYVNDYLLKIGGR